MKPRKVTDEDLRFWNGFKRVYKCPPSLENCEDVETVFDNQTVKIPWLPNEIDVAALAKGGTVWLTIWGRGMPPVDVQVVE